MQAQTRFRSIQWRIDLARARVLRTQLRDFFNRSMARFDTARLNETTVSGISQAAYSPSPTLWARLRSSIQTRFAARRFTSTETPKREKVTMPKRNLYGPEPNKSEIITIDPFPVLNPSGTHSRGNDCSVLINENHYEEISDFETDLVDTPQSNFENKTEWESALSSPNADPSVVRVSFNPNDQDSFSVESNGASSQAAGNNSQTGATGSNVVNGNVSQMLGNTDKVFLANRLGSNVEHDSQTHSVDKELEDLAILAQQLDASVYRRLQDVRNVFKEEKETDHSKPAFVNSTDPVPSDFLEQHMSVGSTMSFGQTTNFSPLCEDSAFTSPGTPVASSSPNSSVVSSSSGEETNLTIQQVSTEMDTEAQQEVTSQDSMPSPPAAAIVPVRPAPSIPTQDTGAIKKTRQKKEWPKNSDYNLRSKKGKK